MIRSQSKYLLILGYYLILYSEKVNGQFGDNTVSEADCKQYCHSDCNQYFDSEVSKFSTCVRANVHCNCGLPWYGLLIAAIASLIVVAFCCVCLFNFIGKHKATPIGVVGGSYMNPFGPSSTILYSEQRNSGFESPPRGHLPYSHTTQPAFNPSYTDNANASAPSFTVLNELSSPVSNSVDAPPSYNEVVKQKADR